MRPHRTQTMWVLIVTLVLLSGFVWANSAWAWTADITAKQEQNLGDVNQYSVAIGVGEQANRYSVPPPMAGDTYSVWMKLYTIPDMETFDGDVRQEGLVRYTWIIGVDPIRDILTPSPRTVTLSWNPLEFEPGIYELREGIDETGMIAVADMSTTTSYDVVGPSEIQYFTLIFTEIDNDGDDVPDRLDNCLNVFNPDQEDGDGDGAGDACDGCPDDPGKVDDTDFDSDGTLDCNDTDDDNDGMPDEWEVQYGINPLFDDADDDPDGDGFSNFREYQADTNPQDADDFPPVTTVDLSLPSGWSMISLPVILENTPVSNLFLDAVVVYGYAKGTGYVRVKDYETLAVGKGYWILLNEDKTYTLTGQPIPWYTKKVSEVGWAMIGGCTDPAQVIPHGCNIRVIYGYTQGVGYQRITGHLERGKGYWILFENVTDQAEIRVEAITESGK